MSAARQEVVQATETAQIVPVNAVTMAEVITRAMADPNTDVEKLDRLMAMAERLQGREAQQSYDEAMNACQEEMRPIATDANNPQTKSRYASFAQLDKALRPIYTKHGFSLSFGSGDGAPADHVRVVCRIAHRRGHRENEHLDMPADGKGAKGGDVMTKTHATGAAVTYGRRYLLGMIFNIAVGEDDDGNGASPKETGTVFKRACEEVNAFEAWDDLKAWKVNKFAGVEKMLSPGERNELVRLVNRRAEALKPKGN